MALANYVKPGDKIDINFLHENNGKTYKSGLFDVISDSEIEITMPTIDGKIVMFNVGAECTFYFYGDKSLYTCEAIITNRYKRGNFYLLSAKIKKGLKRFQRREYFRFACLIDFIYYIIPEEVSSLETTEEIMKVISNPEYNDRKRMGRTKDLSGGGMRFITMEELEIGTKVLALLRLSNEKINQMFYLVTDVVACESVGHMEGLWITRGKFEFKDIKDRDTIISYVFEEDRMKRRKENW